MYIKERGRRKEFWVLSIYRVWVEEEFCKGDWEGGVEEKDEN